MKRMNQSSPRVMAWSPPRTMGQIFFQNTGDAFFNRIIAGVNIAGGDVEIADVSALQALHDIDLHDNVIYPPAKGPVSLVNSVPFVDIEEYNMSIDGR